MDPESEDGNIEYKISLLEKSEERLNQLVTQMRYRCNQGEGECIYNLGVTDDGNMIGITKDEFEETIENINNIADKNNYLVKLLSEVNISNTKKVYEVLIREKNDNKYIDIKVAIAGNVNAGKSSLLGRLITGVNDNGRGLSRSSIFNYSHELKSGRTSSIAHHILGFNSKGEIVNNQGIIKSSWNDIVQKSFKIISFIDLAGHEKYLKTTIIGLSSCFPDFCIIIVAANDGMQPITKEHIFLCVILKIPFIIIISKVDICVDRKNVLQDTIKSINKFLKYPGIRRISINIKTEEDIILGAKNIYSESIVPIFYISNVTGEGIDNLSNFFNIIGKRPNINNIKENTDNNVEFHIDNIFNVSGFGKVIGGYLVNGTIKIGDKLFLGPGYGEYESINIKSIHCKKISLQIVSYGSYVCLGIKKFDKIIKRGNVIISSNVKKLNIKKFFAKVDILKTHSTTVKIGYEPTLHAYSIRQVAKILDIKDKKNNRNTLIDDNILRNGDSAIIEFEFKYKPEYLKVGTIFVLCEGKCKIVGEVISK